MNAAFAIQPENSQKIRDLWGYQGEHNGDGGPYTGNVNLIFNTNTAAEWVKAGKELCNTMHYCIVYHGYEADGTAGAQTLLLRSRSYSPWDSILPPPAEEMIYIDVEDWDDNGERRHPNTRSFPTKNTAFQYFEQNFRKLNIRQQQILDVIRKSALRLFTAYEESVDAYDDVT